MNNKIQSLVRENISKLIAYQNLRANVNLSKPIILDANESPVGSYNRYPDPYQSKLREKLAGMNSITANQLAIGNGSDELIDLIFRIFCEPKVDKALTFSPSFSMYDIYAQINDIQLDKISLNEDFQIDFEAFFQQLENNNYKVIFICSPNNPTGNKLVHLEKILNSFKGIVVIDEAYIEFCELDSCQKYLNTFPNLIILRTLSKAWAAAGIRVGYAMSSTDIIQLYNQTKPPYNVSAVSQEIALQILENNDAVRDTINEIIKQKNLLIKDLENIKSVIKIYPSDANFLFVKVKNADRMHNFLIKNGILTSNRSKQVENCLRITIGTITENEYLINILKTYE